MAVWWEVEDQSLRLHYCEKNWGIKLDSDWTCQEEIEFLAILCGHGGVIMDKFGFLFIVSGQYYPCRRFTVSSEDGQKWI